MRYAARLRVITQGGAVKPSENKLRVTAADEVLVLLSAATDYHGFAGRNTPDPIAAAADDISKAAGKAASDLRRAHMHEYQHWFKRVSLVLDDGQGPAARRCSSRFPDDSSP